MSTPHGLRSTLSLRTLALAVASMLAFAANSVLCRLALHDHAIDPFSFGMIRLASGAVTLFLIQKLRDGPALPLRSDWPAALALFAYVAFFSFAYLVLSTGTGALILFGAVQLTMLGAGLRNGERPGRLAIAGMLLAIAGLVYLLSPGITAPPLLPAACMAAAGIAWGFYSLRGQKIANPLAATARNFALAAPLSVVAVLLTASQAHASTKGVALALTSGMLTSGIGYVIWYAALPGLSAMRAATMQLSVPLIAALGGLLLIEEAITLRLAVAAISILGGIALVLARPPAKSQQDLR